MTKVHCVHPPRRKRNVEVKVRRQNQAVLFALCGHRCICQSEPGEKRMMDQFPCGIAPFLCTHDELPELLPDHIKLPPGKLGEITDLTQHMRSN